MPHPIHKSVNSIFPKKNGYFSNQMKQKLCVYIVLFHTINYKWFLLSENKREENLMLRLVEEW